MKQRVAFVWTDQETAFSTLVVTKLYAKIAVRDSKKKLNIKFVQFVETESWISSRFSTHDLDYKD